MGNVAMRGAFLVKLTDYPETDSADAVGRLSEETISRTIQEIEEIAQIGGKKEILVVLKSWKIRSCAKTIG